MDHTEQAGVKSHKNYEPVWVRGRACVCVCGCEGGKKRVSTVIGR